VALGGKRVIHNYATAAAASRSWGTAQMALEIGFAGTQQPYAVIGCGVIGLSTARLLQQRGATSRSTRRACRRIRRRISPVDHWEPHAVHDERVATEPYRAAIPSRGRASPTVTSSSSWDPATPSTGAAATR
jgi:hypothetical protein